MPTLLMIAPYYYEVFLNNLELALWMELKDRTSVIKSNWVDTKTGLLKKKTHVTTISLT
jgi:hypothetical protein